MQKVVMVVDYQEDEVNQYLAEGWKVVEFKTISSNEQNDATFLTVFC